MTLTNNTASRPRKTLASQLDRLDGILDALSDGLNQAVASAVEQAVAAAVKEAVIEVVTNPELRQLLQPPPVAVPLPVAPPPVNVGESGGWLAGLWQGVRQVAVQAAKAVGHAARAAWNWVTATAVRAGELAAGGAARLRRGACRLYAWLLSHRLAAVATVGGLAAVAYCLAGTAVAGTVGGLALPALLFDVPACVLWLFGCSG
jgi:hypothetical protein